MAALLDLFLFLGSEEMRFWVFAIWGVFERNVGEIDLILSVVLDFTIERMEQLTRVVSA